MPVTSVKQWVSTADARTRSHHANMNGVEVGIDDEFTVITDGLPIKMRYAGDYKGGPRNVINCRCTILYIDKTPDEETQIVDPQPDSPRRESPEPWVFREGIKPFFEYGNMALTQLFGLNIRKLEDAFDPDAVDSAMFRYGRRWDTAKRGATELGILPIEAAPAFAYTTGHYTSINQFFRDWFEGKSKSEIGGKEIEINDATKAEALGFRDQMKKTFEKLPAYKGEVHRGVSNSVEKRMRQFGIEEVGATYRAESFLSTSYKKGAEFDKQLVFILNSKTGRKIDTISEYGNEKEVMFLPGAEFKVTRIEKGEGPFDKTFIYMDEIGEELKAVNNNPVLIGGDEIISYSRRFLAKMASQDELTSVNNRLILLG